MNDSRWQNEDTHSRRIDHENAVTASVMLGREEVIAKLKELDALPAVEYATTDHLRKLLAKALYNRLHPNQEMPKFKSLGNGVGHVEVTREPEAEAEARRSRAMFRTLAGGQN